MKWKLSQKTKTTLEGKPASAELRRLTDREEILSYLQPRRGYSATAIAQLEPNSSQYSKWFLARRQEQFTLGLISKSILPGYIFTLGNELTLDFLLHSIPLPAEAFITCEAEHLEVVKRYYELEWHYLMKRMIVTREGFSPAADKAERLRPAHVNELNKLYKAHNGNVFSARQIRKGAYYGIWRDGQIVSVAGTHLISPTYGLACVGNVLTHPAYRNQGLATICTSTVTEELLEYCTEVVLNVEPQNCPAVRAYESLGYEEDCLIVEALGRRKSFVEAIITNLWRKLGLSPT